MEDDKPVVEITVEEIEYVGVTPGLAGTVRIILRTDRAQDVALVLPPTVLASLEAKLAAVREHQAGGSPVQ